MSVQLALQLGPRAVDVSDPSDTPQAQLKTCACCHTAKPATSECFGKDRHERDGLNSHCRPCNKEKSRGTTQALPVSTPKVECYVCHATKPSAEFTSSNIRADGTRGRCKACHLQYNKQYHAKRRQVPKVQVLSKQCRQCGVTKMANMFSRDMSQEDGLRGECKGCNAAAEELSGRRKRVFEPTVDHKVCNSCQEDKAAEAFNQMTRSKDGLDPKCKACTNAAWKARQVTKAVLQPQLKFKVCQRCLIGKTSAEFFRETSRGDGLNHLCKPCCKLEVEAFKARLQAGGYQQVQQQQCNRCEEVKDAAHFCRATIMRTGLSGTCRSCVSKRGRERRAQRALDPKPEVTCKSCPACGVSLPAEDFYPRPYFSDGLSRYCRPCTILARNVAERKRVAKRKREKDEEAADDGEVVAVNPGPKRPRKHAVTSRVRGAAAVQQQQQWQGVQGGEQGQQGPKQKKQGQGQGQQEKKRVKQTQGLAQVKSGDQRPRRREARTAKAGTQLSSAVEVWDRFAVKPDPLLGQLKVLGSTLTSSVAAAFKAAADGSEEGSSKTVQLLTKLGCAALEGRIIKNIKTYMKRHAPQAAASGWLPAHLPEELPLHPAVERFISTSSPQPDTAPVQQGQQQQPGQQSGQGPSLHDQSGLRVRPEWHTELKPEPSSSQGQRSGGAPSRVLRRRPQAPPSARPAPGAPRPRLRSGDVIGPYTGLLCWSGAEYDDLSRLPLAGCQWKGSATQWALQWEAYAIDLEAFRPQGERGAGGLASASAGYVQGEGLVCCPLVHGSVLSCVNDPRREPLVRAQLGPLDGQANVATVEVQLGWWPFLFMVATDDAGPGQELLMDYGEEYWKGRQAAAHCVRQRLKTPSTT